MKKEQKPLWTCPRCGHSFVMRNIWHSCGRYRIDDHFLGKDPVVRQLFDRLVELARSNGPLTAYAQKTRIVLQVRVRFAGVVTRKQGLEVGLWLKRRAHHPRLKRIEDLSPTGFGHHFLFTSLEELDRGFVELLNEAYGIGCQIQPKTDSGKATGKPLNRKESCG